MCNRQPVESDVHICTTYVASVVLHWFCFILNMKYQCSSEIANHTKFSGFMLSDSLQKTHCGWYRPCLQSTCILLQSFFYLAVLFMGFEDKGIHGTCPCLHLPNLLSFYHMTAELAQKFDYLIYDLPPFIIRSPSVIQKGRTDLYFGSL